MDTQVAEKNKAIVRKKRTTINTSKSKVKPKDIPSFLIYEEMDGKPIYYKGYEQVVNNNKTLDDIMGSSTLQSIIIAYIIKFLNSKIDEKYLLLSNELGLHLEKGNNLSSDIAIYEKAVLLKDIIINKYSEIPPKIVIEVDTKADLNNFDSTMDYFKRKTQKLFAFGVERVIWILSHNRQVMVAVPNQNWYIMDWDKELEIIDNHKLNIAQLLADGGVKL